MGLDRDALRDAIKTALESAVKEEWSLDKVASAWADAIDTFVRGGAVTDVESDVNVKVFSIANPSQQIGTGTGSGTQTGVGRIE